MGDKVICPDPVPSSGTLAQRIRLTLGARGRQLSAPTAESRKLPELSISREESCEHA